MHVHVEFGHIIVRRRHGRVADYCCICREFTACTMLGKKTVPTANFIPYWFGEVTGYENECETCNTRWAVARKQFDSVSNDRRATLARLVAATNSRPGADLLAKLVLSERAKIGNLTEYELMTLADDALSSLDKLFMEYKWLRRKEQRMGGDGCLYWNAVLFGVTALVLYTIPVPAVYKILTTAATVAFLALGEYCRRTRMKRFYRDIMLPKLLRAFKPLKLSKDEIMKFLEKYKYYEITKFISPEELSN